jgi:uncharacterized protein YraI
MRRTVLLASMVVAGLLAPAPAAAQYYGYATRNVNVRAGPDRSYPLVGWVQEGAEVEIFGCIESWRWCDIQAGVYRGWAYTGYIAYPYDGGWASIRDIGPESDLPLLAFELDVYWNSYYTTWPWYAQWPWWVSRPPIYVPPWRPPPRPPVVHPRPPVGVLPPRPPAVVPPIAKPPGGKPPVTRPVPPSAVPPAMHPPPASRPPSAVPPPARPPTGAQRPSPPQSSVPPSVPPMTTNPAGPTPTPLAPPGHSPSRPTMVAPAPVPQTQRPGHR